MAEMIEIIETLKSDLREGYDHNKMSLLLHYLERFNQLYGQYSKERIS